MLTVAHNSVYSPEFLLGFAHPGLEARRIANVDCGTDRTGAVHSALKRGKLIASDGSAAERNIGSFRKKSFDNGLSNASSATWYVLAKVSQSRWFSILTSYQHMSAGQVSLERRHGSLVKYED